MRKCANKQTEKPNEHEYQTSTLRGAKVRISVPPHAGWVVPRDEEQHAGYGLPKELDDDIAANKYDPGV